MGAIPLPEGSNAPDTVRRFRGVDAILFGSTITDSIFEGGTYTGGTFTDSTLVDATIVPEDWIAPILLNSWINYATGFQVARYRITKEGIVQIQGLLANGSAHNAIMLKLPTGYRPDAELILPGVSSAGAGDLRISGDGNVRMAVGGSTSWNSITVSFQT